MSRAFTKEDREEAPLVVPRAPLPPGLANYVTASGLAALRRELSRLQTERAAALAARDPLHSNEPVALNERILSLQARLASAVLVDVAELPHDEVRFSATVTLRSESGAERRYRIVGVDEADARADKIAFVAPLAKALLGKKVGETVNLPASSGERELEIVRIEYHTPTQLGD